MPNIVRENKRSVLNVPVNHLTWQCPPIQGFWSQVVKILCDIMGSPIPLTPQCCLLRIFEVPDLSRMQTILLNASLLQARRLLARNWMNGHIPTVPGWILTVNTSLPYRKLIYTHQGNPKKFTKIWSPWRSSPHGVRYSRMWRRFSYTVSSVSGVQGYITCLRLYSYSHGFTMGRAHFI